MVMGEVQRERVRSHSNGYIDLEPAPTMPDRDEIMREVPHWRMKDPALLMQQIHSTKAQLVRKLGLPEQPIDQKDMPHDQYMKRIQIQLLDRKAKKLAGNPNPSISDVMYAYKRDYSFSESFLNLMYQDNSLASGTRFRNKALRADGVTAETEDAVRLGRAERRKLMQIAALEEKQRKRNMIAVFGELADIEYTEAQTERLVQRLTEQQLFIKLRQKQMALIEERAAVRLQKFARMMIHRLKWLQIVSDLFLTLQRKRRIDASMMIQRNYRQYRRFRIIPKLIRRRKQNACVVL
jgi:hypothetical protein